MIEKRRLSFDAGGNAGAGFTDALKTFDSINKDFLITKLIFFVFVVF